MLHFPIRLRLIMTIPLLAASASQVSIAQPRFNPNIWDNSYYGIAGGSASNDFCNHLQAGKGVARETAPTVKEAVASAVCSEAYTMLSAGRLVLIDDLKIKIGSKTMNDGAIVYPLSGSFTLYECQYQADSRTPRKNCNSVEYPEATGTCRKSTSGSWACRMDLRVEPPDGYNYDPQGKWATHFIHQEVPPPEPEPVEAAEFYLATIAADGLPFNVSLQPIEKQNGEASELGTRVTIKFEGERAAMRLKADAVPEFRMKQLSGEGAQGTLIRFTVENGARTVSFVETNGTMKYESLPTVQSTSELVGPTIKLTLPAPLAPGEYGLFYHTMRKAYMFGVD